jgi:rSAM/selenodomain-associated transferase 1
MNKALLIFAKQPYPGKVKTRLSPPLSLHEAAELYRCMLSDTLAKVVVLSGVEKIIVYESSPGAGQFFRTAFPGVRCFPQQGAGLGERLEKAFEKVFGLGFELVAAIGTDSPDLPVSHLEESFRLLERNAADVAFGPASDGGYYLVALKSFLPEVFRKIPWSTGQVLEKSVEVVMTLGLRVVYLPVWHDLDTIEDLVRFLLGGGTGGAVRTRQFLIEFMNNKILYPA